MTADQLTARARLILAPNPSPMTLTGTNTWLLAEPTCVNEEIGSLMVEGRPRLAGVAGRLAYAIRLLDCFAKLL